MHTADGHRVDSALGRRPHALVVAVEKLSGLCHVFDVSNATDAVPRRAAPIATISPPGATALSAPVASLVAAAAPSSKAAPQGTNHPRLAFGRCDGGGGAPVLLVSAGDVIGAAPLQQVSLSGAEEANIPVSAG